MPTPKKFKWRPTTDFAKEGLFNLLHHRIDLEGISVLDLFSGTGNIAYEFASRGASQVICVEKDANSCKVIRKNFELLAFESFSVIPENAFRFLNNTHTTWDLIFADPPFHMENIEDIPKLVFENQLLKSEGMFILEHAASVNFEGKPHFMEKRSYGNICFSFFQ